MMKLLVSCNSIRLRIDRPHDAGRVPASIQTSVEDLLRMLWQPVLSVFTTPLHPAVNQLVDMPHGNMPALSYRAV